MFENLIHSRLIESLEEKQIIYYRKFGFRKNFSTNHAILSSRWWTICMWDFHRPFHFADDTCLLKEKDSIKKISTVVNKDLKFLIQWLHTNKTSLNVAKNEVIIFRRKKKQLDFDLNLKICEKKLQVSSYVKYLGIYLDQYLDWSPHVNHLSHKLVKANAMLCKLRHYVNEATIKSIYYAIFHSHLSYVCTAWGQNLNP